MTTVRPQLALMERLEGTLEAGGADQVRPFIYELVHEIRAPLSAAIMVGDLLLDRSDAEGEIRMWISRMKEQVEVVCGICREMVSVVEAAS